MDREWIEWTEDETMSFVSQAMSLETDQNPTANETSDAEQEHNTVQAIQAPAEENDTDGNVELKLHNQQDTNDNGGNINNTALLQENYSAQNLKDNEYSEISDSAKKINLENEKLEVKEHSEKADSVKEINLQQENLDDTENYETSDTMKQSYSQH